MDFRSKVDGWFLALFWGMALVIDTIAAQRPTLVRSELSLHAR